MAKRRLIEDSDQEDSAEDIPPSQGQDSSRVLGDGPLVAQDTPQQSAGQGTASTETLNREMRNARNALTEPTPHSTLSPTRFDCSSQQQSPTSPTMTRGTMRRIKTVVEMPRVKKPLKTYGSQDRDKFDFRGDSDGELDATPRMDITFGRSKHNQNPEGGTMGSAWTLLSGDTEILDPGSSSADKRALFQRFMPPPALKATSFEKIQRSETGTTRTTLDPTPVSLWPKAVASSFDPTYSNERIPEPTLSARARDEEGHVPDRDDPYRPGKRPRLHMDDNSQNDAGLIESSLRSASIISASNPIAVEEGAHAEILSGEEGSRDKGELPLSDPAITLPQPPQFNGCQNELSVVAENTTKGELKSSRRRDTKDTFVDELGSDDIAIGLPKEHYQPRPSKSRSSRGNEEVLVSVDYSKRPEAIVKKNRKLSRRKTTAFHELIPKEEDEGNENEVAFQPSLEFPRSRALKDTKERDEVDCECGEIEEDNRKVLETDPKQSPRPILSAKHRGRPKKGLSESREDPKETALGQAELGIKETDTENDLQEKPETVPPTEVKPTESKKQRGRPKKGAPEIPKSRTSDEVHNESSKDDSESAKFKAVTTAQNLKKKDRTNDIAMTISEEVVDSADELGAGSSNGDLHRSILHETEGNIVLPKPIRETNPSPSPTKPNAVPPETPHKPNPQKGPEKHSPISSGTLAYRVGLSKRAKIEPLLRIVRKC